VKAPGGSNVMKLQIQIDEKGKLMASRFKILGCGSEIDPSSLFIE
jgi:NifU-like protein involved in Fe-S cluster formation